MPSLECGWGDVRNRMRTLSEPQDRTEARVRIGDLLARVKIRQEGDAVYARLELDAGALVSVASNSSKFSYFKCGSGGVTIQSPTKYRLSLAA